MDAVLQSVLVDEDLQGGAVRQRNERGRLFRDAAQGGVGRLFVVLTQLGYN